MGLVVYNVAWAETCLRTKCQVASWSIQPFGHNRHRPKSGGAVLLLGGAGSHLTIWPGPGQATSMPSFILIYPTVWPQHTNVTDRQIDRQTHRTDNGLIAQGEPFYKNWKLSLTTSKSMRARNTGRGARDLREGTLSADNEI